MDCTHADVPELLVGVAQADVEVKGVALDVVGGEGRVAGVSQVELRTVEAHHEQCRTHADAHPPAEELRVEGILNLYLLVREGSDGVVEESCAYAVLRSDEEEGHVGIDEHRLRCSLEPHHLHAVGTLYIKLAVEPCRCGVVVGLECPGVGKRRVELCPCAEGHDEHTYPEQSFHPTLNNVNGVCFIVSATA